jgi:uncharacterized protein YndB with AHSA1/START domain
MSPTTDVPADEPLIIMRRIFDASRDIIWDAITESRHVARWWGGPDVINPVCEMDVRPGGLWRHVMRFPDGRELRMNFVFLEVDKPKRLVWRHVDHGKVMAGPPTSIITVTLDDVKGRTAWKMVARFGSLAERDAALAIGFSKRIEASNEQFVEYLKKLGHSGEAA